MFGGQPSRMTSTAKRVTLLDCAVEHRTGRARLEYQIDDVSHTIHAIFHDAPRLDPDTWRVCLEDLGLACLIDLATASLARHLTATGLSTSNQASSWVSSASRALRLECLAEGSLPLRYLNFDLHLSGHKAKQTRTYKPNRKRVLLLMGGGKDSLYSYQLLRSAGFEVECFYMTEGSRTWQQLRRTYSALAKENVQHRAFLNANQMGRVEKRFRRDYATQFQIGQALFLSIPYALGRGCQYLAFGAERTANIRTGFYRGISMNHQHEKSESFLALLNQYLRIRFRGALEIFSPLYGLFDTGIYARFLSLSEGFLDLQSSCGGSNSYRRHCGRCEKCAFVAALLAGLSGDREILHELFPINPLDDLSLFDDWYHGRFQKPRACVGSLNELRVALRLGRARGWNTPIHDYDRRYGSPPGVASLSHYLSTHDSRSIPRAISNRIAPFLRFDPTPLTELFRTCS